MSEIITVAYDVIDPIGSIEVASDDGFGTISYSSVQRRPRNGFRLLTVIESGVYAEQREGPANPEFGIYAPGQDADAGTADYVTLRWVFQHTPGDSPVQGRFTVAYFKD